MNKKARKSGRSKRTARFRNLTVLLAVLLVVTLVMGVGTAEGTVSRIGGDDRYQTSALLAEEAFSDGATTVIIARGDQAGNFADGLASSVLSGALDAPVLLTKPNALPADIKTAIRSLGATRAIVLGGTEAISSSVVAGLRDLNLTVSRIEGKDRYETAAKVAREADKKGYIRSYAFIVNGFATADSLVVAPAAFRDNAVILQVAKNSIPKATKEALKDLNINKVYIIGGTAVVSQTVERELEKSYIVKRYRGADRYETSVLVAEGLFPGVDQMVLAGGPDAHLVDSIGACMFGKPILYVKKNEIPRVVEYYLEDTITAYSDPLIIGGTAAISKSVERAVDKILEKAEDGGSDPGATPVYSTTVKTADAFRKAIENNNIKTITLGKDVTGNVTATRSGTTNLTINFADYQLTGNLTITANRIKALKLNGSATPAISGDLTVTANKATVTNSLSVGGTVYIEDVSSSSWIEQVDGNRIILTDENGATIIIEGQPGSVTVEAGAGENGDINIIVHRPVTITVENGADVKNITVADAADGTSIINDGTIETVTADGDVEIINNSDSPIEVSGDGTATVSGKGADQVTGDNVEFVVSAITITTKVIGGDSMPGDHDDEVDRHERPFAYNAEIEVYLETATEGAEIYCTLYGIKPAYLAKNTMDFGKVTGDGIVLDAGEIFKQVFEETDAKHGGQVILEVRATKDGYIDRTEEFIFVFEAENTPVTILNQNYYAPGNTLEFTISNLRPGKEVEVGMPIYLGPYGWPWASGELVLTEHDGLELVQETRGEEIIRFWAGTADGEGKITVRGTVGPELSNGKLCITLPNSGHTIDNAISLKYDQAENINVHVGDPIRLEGVPVVGEELTAAHLTPEVAKIWYQWQRADSEDGTYVAIEDENNKTYTVVDGDAGKWIRVKMMSNPDHWKDTEAEWDILYRWGTSYSEPIGPVPAQTLAEAKAAVEGVLDDYEVSNETTEAQLLADVKEVVTNEEINVSIGDFALEAATTEKAGSITGTVKLELDTDEETVEIGIEIAQLPATEDQAAPTGLDGVAPTSESVDDGKITGVDDTMEWTVKGEDDWTLVEEDAEEITGLSAGTYEVRYAAKEGYNAGEAAEVVVPEYEKEP